HRCAPTGAGRAGRARPAGVRSAGGDVDGDGHPVGEDVVHRGAGPGPLDELTQRLGRGVALDRELHGDVLVAVAHLGVEPKDAVEVDVAGHDGADLGEPDPAGGGDVGQSRGDAGGQRVQDELHRGGAVVAPDEDGGVVGVEVEGALVRALLADAEEAVDG